MQACEAVPVAVFFRVVRRSDVDGAEHPAVTLNQAECAAAGLVLWATDHPSFFRPGVLATRHARDHQVTVGAGALLTREVSQVQRTHRAR